MDIKIIVATHIPYWMPEDEMYLPLQVGKAGNPAIGFQGDDTGENISDKNPYFCELTGLYWAWKNLNADYIGLAHYRRHFSIRPQKDKKESVLTRQQLESLLKSTDVVLPKKRSYYIETLYSHYSHTHDSSHLDRTRDIIDRKYPDYLTAFDKVMKSRSAHMFNMFIMEKKLADRYCEWIFDILFDLEKEIDTSKMTAYEARLFGRISELLLNVWINKNGIRYKEIPYVHLEPVKWVKKISGFLKAKFMKEKYTESW